MHVLREQREYEVLEAAQEEHAAWTELERAIRPERADEALVQVCRERWQVASRRLVQALEGLKVFRR